MICFENIIIAAASHSHHALDGGIWIIALEVEIFVFEVENALHIGINHHLRQLTRCAGELLMHLVEVIGVDVSIAEGMDVFARLQSGDLCHHHEQQGIRSDVERHAEENVAAALIELQTEFAISHIKLEKRVARRQSHVWHLSHIPCAHYDATAVGGVLYLVDGLGYLVDMPALIIGPRAPLIAIDMAQIAVFVGPFVPNAHSVFLQIVHIGVALQEPEQLIYYRLQVHLLGGEQRKTVGKIEAHLVAKHAFGARACAVALLHSVGEHVLY